MGEHYLRTKPPGQAAMAEWCV